jgi:hypothetical protein
MTLDVCDQNQPKEWLGVFIVIIPTFHKLQRIHDVEILTSVNAANITLSMWIYPIVKPIVQKSF